MHSFLHGIMLKKLIIGCCVVALLSSCGLLGIGSKKSGCPSNGKNVGAEKIVSGNGKPIKAPKYKFGKSYNY